MGILSKPKPPTGRAFNCSTNTASEAFAMFLDGLRTTGTDLPMTNHAIAHALADAMQWKACHSTGKVATAFQNLALDFEVISEALDNGEEEIDEDEEG